MQDANNSTAHIGDKDYIATPWTEATGLNNIHFSFQHVSAVLWLNIKMPDNTTAYKSVTLSADEPMFASSAKLDLQAVRMATDGNRQYVNPSCITDKTMTDALKIDFTGDVKADADNMLKVWMMVLPADFTGRTMTVTVETADGCKIVYKVDPERSFLSGMAYRLNIEGGDDSSDSSGMVGPVFTSKDGKQWRFTSGNLYYNTRTDTWYIYDKQTECIKAGGTNIQNTSPELIGLFAWGATGLEDAQKPWCLLGAGTTNGKKLPSTDTSKNSLITDLWDNDYVYDWGRAYMEKGRTADDKREYRTPSPDIIKELMTSSFVQGATIKGAGLNGTDATGLLIIPGTYTLAEAKSFINSVEGASCLSNMQELRNNSSGATLNYKNITITDYAALKKLNDAIFLPAAGGRITNSSPGSYGYYWTSKGSSTGSNAFNIIFRNTTDFFYNGNSGSNTVRSYQMAVRLLVEVK